MAVTLASLRNRIESDLDDTTLQTIIDASVQAVDRACGKSDSEVENFQALGSTFICLSRRVSSITTIVERASVYSDPVTLSSDDYRAVGYRYRRLATGTNPRTTWGAEVEVTYVPEVDADLRDSVTLDLCQMVAEFRALDKEKVGDWEGEQKDYQKRRRALLASITEGRSTVL